MISLSPASAAMTTSVGSRFIVLAQAMIPRTGMMDSQNPMPMKERYLKRFPQPARIGELIGVPVLDLNSKTLSYVDGRDRFYQSPVAGSELRGKLIQTASIAAYRGGQAYTVHYAASKAGVVSITRTAAQVLATDRITSNCICPGAVDTPMWRKIDAEWTEIDPA
jgi:hypothetical protein